MKAGSWPSILAVYLFGVLGVSTLSKMIPLVGDLEHALGASPAQYAFLLSLLALAPAVLGAAGGAVIDRVGPRKALIASGVVGAAADVLYGFAPTVFAFQAIRVFEGLIMLGIFTSGPALLMATTSGRRRVSAMTLWSTYTPTGFSLGLVLAGAFAGTAAWRWTFAVHGLLFASAAVLALWLPKLAPAEAAGPRPSVAVRFAELFSTYLQLGPLRLALAFGAVISLGLGVSTVMPSYLARAHGLSIGAASELLAAANFSMIGGAFLTSAWLGAGRRPKILYLGLAVVGSLAGAVLLEPATPFALEIGALCIWLLVTGAGTAFALAVLPAVVSDPRKGAAAAGLFSQISSVVTLLTPPFWLAVFGGEGWAAFVGLIVAGWTLSLLLLPPGVERAAAAPRPLPTPAVGG